MNTQELTALLDRLCAEPHESEWLEFKANRFEPQALGEYLSALANSACLLGKPRAYMVFGIEDGSHAVVGTNFDPIAETVKGKEGKGNQLLPLWLSLGLLPNTGFEIHPFTYRAQRVVLFEIHPAFDQPAKFYGTAYIRDGSSKTELARYPEKQRQIWQRRVDWSAQICERATLSDLDPAAIAKARTEYKTKFPARAADLGRDLFEQGQAVDTGRANQCRFVAAGFAGIDIPFVACCGAD
ncbi:MAG: ATP-binding protein [Gallionella sp.]|jgi:ATP-dependent DNA helicase RecG